MGRRIKGHESEAEWLRVRGFDGLYHPDPAMACGCYVGDLRPCGDSDTPCRGGHATPGVDGVFGRSRTLLAGDVL